MPDYKIEVCSTRVDPTAYIANGEDGTDTLVVETTVQLCKSEKHEGVHFNPDGTMERYSYWEKGQPEGHIPFWAVDVGNDGIVDAFCVGSHGVYRNNENSRPECTVIGESDINNKKIHEIFTNGGIYTSPYPISCPAYLTSRDRSKILVYQKSAEDLVDRVRRYLAKTTDCPLENAGGRATITHNSDDHVVEQLYLDDCLIGTPNPRATNPMDGVEFLRGFELFISRSSVFYKENEDGIEGSEHTGPDGFVGNNCSRCDSL